MAKSDFVPTAPNTLVTGIKGKFDGPSDRCVGHLFLTAKAKKSEHWQSGWVQGAHCLVCDRDIIPMDAAWWLDLATDDDIRECMRFIKSEAERLKNIHIYLKELL